MEKGVRYFLYVKVPLFIVVLVDFFIAWVFKLYWVIEKAVVNSPHSIQLNTGNILLGFFIGALINLAISVTFAALGVGKIKEVDVFDVRQIVFTGLLFWIFAAGFENSLRAAFFMIVILSIGELSMRTKWGTQTGFKR